MAMDRLVFRILQSSSRLISTMNGDRSKETATLEAMNA